MNVLEKYSDSDWNFRYNSDEYPGTVAEKPWYNTKAQLPKTLGSYKEYDVNPKIGTNRDAQRFVVEFINGIVKNVYYTDNHYGQISNGNPDFYKIKLK